jgi:hypothetical protein
MSFFHDNIEILKKAIEYFNSLKEERKAFLVANIITANAYTQEELDFLRPFLQAIQLDIVNHSEFEIAQKIFQLGMDETYSQLFVKNIVKQAPTWEYHLNVLSQIDKKVFEEKFTNIIHDLYIKQDPSDEIMTKYNLTLEQFNAVLFGFNITMNSFLRQDMSENYIKQQLKTRGFSDTTAEVFMNTLKIHSDHARKVISFQSTQDSLNGIVEIKEQNKTILETLREILKILRDAQTSRQNPYS